MSARPPHELLATTQFITIHGVALAPVEHSGVRVMTLSMIDQVHQRPEGTAGRTFRDNRGRLIVGEDYFELDQPDAIRRLGFLRPQGGTPSKVLLITETGYSMLVKTFSDDLAWDVQRQLVKSYFAKPAPAPKLRRTSASTSSLLSDARAIDFIGNMISKVPGARQDVVAAIKLRMIEERTGLPATQFGGALPAEALEKAVKLNPTEIGKRLVPKLSPNRINTMLIHLGLQRKSESGYVLTEAGAAHGESRPFQAANKHVGDQIDWYESIVDVVRAEIQRPSPPGAQGKLDIK